MALCCFNATNSLFAAVTSLAENRLNLYDTVSGSLRHQFVTDHHLNKQNAYTAIAVSQSKSKKKKQQKQEQKEDSGLIALGTEKGLIVVFQIQTGEVLYRLGERNSEGHSLRVNHLVFDEKSALYSCSEDKTIIEWNMQNGELVHKWSSGAHAQNSLALKPDEGILASASAEITLWDLSSKRQLKSYVGGHSTPVTSLSFSADGRFLLSAASDRFVTLWDAVGENTHPVQTFCADSEPIFTQFSPFISDESESKSQHPYHLLAASRRGVINIWFYMPPLGAPAPAPASDSKEKKKKKKKAEIENPALPPSSRVVLPKREKSADDYLVLCSKFHSNHSLMVACGSTVVPYFDSISYMNEDGSFKPAVELPLRSASHLLPANGQQATKKRKAPEVNVVSADANSMPAIQQNLEDALLPTETTENKEKESTRKRVRSSRGRKDKGLGLPTWMADTEEIKEAADNEASTSEPSLEERLARLNQNEKKKASGTKQVRGAPRAESLQSVLVQALHTNDSNLLEYCLSNRNLQTITTTIDRLPTPFIIPFLTKVIDRFQSNPHRAWGLLVWIKQILSRHTAYLTSVPDLMQRLDTLYQSINGRLSVFKKLLKLSGRLDLLLSQIAIRNRESSAVLQDTAAVVYDEEAEDLEVDGAIDAKQNNDAEMASGDDEEDNE